jgi:CheY-like chemotaxis protein
VEDEATNRDILRDALAPIGFNVIEAEDGLRGFELAVEHKPNLLLSDIRMPRMDGLELVRRLRALDQFSQTPIIGVTASTQDMDKSMCIDAGCTDFLPKPVRLPDLYDKVAHYLALDWQVVPVAPQPEPVTPASDEIILPPANILERLREAAMLGDVGEVLVILDKLAEQGDKYGLFISTSREMATDFRLNEMEEFFNPNP